MFLRFRQVPSDGSEPIGVPAKILCQGDCLKRRRFAVRGPGALIEGCPRKPRCRWRIHPEGKDLPVLAPYRLQVTIVENVRHNGKVRQEHIGHLGDIPGHLLPAFYDGLDPTDIKKMQGPEWERCSLASRIAFWKTCKKRLAKLSNRLGSDLQRIRMAVHERVPWPMDKGQKKLDVLDAMNEEKRARRRYDQTAKMIEKNERLIENAKRQNVELRDDANREAKVAIDWATRVAQLVK